MPFAYFLSLSPLPSYNFSSWESYLFASLLSSGPVHGDDSQYPPVHFVFIVGRRREGGWVSQAKKEGGGAGGGALILLAKVPRKRKEKK